MKAPLILSSLSYYFREWSTIQSVVNGEFLSRPCIIVFHMNRFHVQSLLNENKFRIIALFETRVMLRVAKNKHERNKLRQIFVCGSFDAI